VRLAQQQSVVHVLQHVEHRHAAEAGVRNRQILRFGLYHGHVQFPMELRQALRAHVQRDRPPHLRQERAGVDPGAAADVQNTLRDDRGTLPQEPEDKLTASGEPEVVPFDLLQPLQAIPPKL
jgi:hypothetical protein